MYIERTPTVTSVERLDLVAGRSTRLTLAFGWSGWLAPFLRLLYGRLARRYVRTDAESLKRPCETPR